jgi:hypothetical protein
MRGLLELEDLANFAQILGCVFIDIDDLGGS